MEKEEADSPSALATKAVASIENGTETDLPF